MPKNVSTSLRTGRTDGTDGRAGRDGPDRTDGQAGGDGPDGPDGPGMRKAKTSRRYGFYKLGFFTIQHTILTSDS